MEEKIKSSVKTQFSKYGLKEGSIEKIVNMLVSKISGMGALDNEDDVISAEVKAIEPLVSIIQSEADFRATKSTKSEPTQSSHLPTEQSHEEDTNERSSEALKALYDQIASIRKELDEKSKKEAMAESMGKVKQLLEDKGATNSTVLGLVLKGVQMGENQTPEQLADQLKAEYDDAYKQLFGNGAVPSYGNGGAASAGNNLDSFKEKLKMEGKLPA